ncbi:MAG: hypothetical protein K6G62_00085, partial [Eubacterium sp.]|nr:hypothetical protein [Eubacterium sp.]
RIRDSREVTGWYDVPALHLYEKLWWHYCASYNARTETITSYINGEVVGIMENVPTNRYVRRIMVGGDVFQPSFVGSICEVAFYNEAKDHEFIADLHRSYTEREDFIAFKQNQAFIDS